MLKENLLYLIDNNLLSMDVLSRITGISKENLCRFLDADDNKALINFDVQPLYSISDCLVDGMKVSEDERVRGIIDVLIQQYGFSLQMISSHTKIPEQEISAFFNGSGDLQIEEKYIIAVKAFSILLAIISL